MKKKIDVTVVNDPILVIKEIIKDAGDVAEELGGFLIRIVNEKKFPWIEVCRYLLSLNHDVWMETRDGELYIITSPKTD